jgi:NADH:ubiquinone oxidoreductase subunit 4 (subunit M)
MMLLFLISLPLFGCFVLSFIDKTKQGLIRNFSLFWSLIILNISFSLLFFFDPTATHFQLMEVIP